MIVKKQKYVFVIYILFLCFYFFCNAERKILIYLKI